MLDEIKDIDKNIQSTEELLSSLLPNIEKVMKEKQERKHKKNRENGPELSDFWAEKKL